MLKLSIITTLYKSEQYLEKCLDSLTNQDIPSDEYEVIVVNDGSPDNSEAIAKSYANRYSIFKVISQNNKGLSGARNTGLKYASGKYVSFVDPDDYIKENSLGGLLKQMEEESLDMLRFNYVLVDEQYQRLQKSKSELTFDYSSQIMTGNEFIGKRLGVACYVWAFIYRLSLIKDNEIWYVEGDYFDDTPWLPLVLTKAERVNCADYELYYYLQRSDSLVKSRSQKSIDAKIEGQYKLLDTLTTQRYLVKDNDVYAWYNMMVSFSSLTLLSLIATKKRETRLNHIKRYDSYNVRPISLLHQSRNLLAKTVLVNVSPRLFCDLIHLKNKG